MGRGKARRRNTLALVATVAVALVTVAPVGGTAAAVATSAFPAATRALLPADAAVNPNPVVTTIACPSAVCVGVGYYFAAPANTSVPLIEVRLAGKVWIGARAPVPSNANTAYPKTLNQLSCPAPDWCMAAGTYSVSQPGADFSRLHTFTVLINNGSISSSELAMPADAATDASAQPTSLSCAAVGRCVLVGSYTRSGGQNAPLIATTANGQWSVAGLPLPQAAASPVVAQVSCATPDDCLAVGHYFESTTYRTRGLIEVYSGGQWTAGTAPDSDSRSTYLDLKSVSCVTADWCAVGGNNGVAGSGGAPNVNTGWLGVLSGGTWQVSAAPVPAGQAPTTGIVQQLTCPQVGWCAAEAANAGTLLMDVLANGAWTTQALSPPADAARQGGLSGGALACAAAGVCLDMGTYQHNDSYMGPYVATLRAGVWDTEPAPVPLDARAMQISDPRMTLACVSATDCAGTYIYPAIGGTFQVAAVDLSSDPILPSYLLTTLTKTTLRVYLRNVPGHANGWHRLRGSWPYAATAVTLASAPAASAAIPALITMGSRHRLASRTLNSQWHALGTSATPCRETPSGLQIGEMLFLACRDSHADLHAAQVTDTKAAIAWTDLHLHTTSAPAIAIADGQITYFVTNAEHQLIATTGRTAQVIARNCASAPSAATNPTRTLTYAACRTTLNKLSYAKSDGHGWNTPRTIPGTIAGRPAVGIMGGSPRFYAQIPNRGLSLTTGSGWTTISSNPQMTTSFISSLR